MEQSVSNSIFIPNGKGTKSLNGTESASDPQLITRRSEVQILLPQPEKAPQSIGLRCFFILFRSFYFCISNTFLTR